MEKTKTPEETRSKKILQQIKKQFGEAQVAIAELVADRDMMQIEVQQLKQEIEKLTKKSV
jgi:hypothetical protein